jgi:hypothetical protein
MRHRRVLPQVLIAQQRRSAHHIASRSPPACGCIGLHAAGSWVLLQPHRLLRRFRVLAAAALYPTVRLGLRLGLRAGLKTDHCISGVV